mgnify:CR=1 FL=1
MNSQYTQEGVPEAHIPLALTAAAFIRFSCLSLTGATSVPKRALVTRPARFTLRYAAPPSMRRHLRCRDLKVASRSLRTGWAHLCTTIRPFRAVFLVKVPLR